MKKISRKGFLKVAAAAAMSGVTASALAACNAGSSSSTAATGEAIYTPGTYTGTATGIGEVKVTMTFSETAITDVVIDASNETESIGGVAAPTLKDALMAAQSTEIDNISGATITTNAVKKAAASCIEQAMGVHTAGGDTAASSSDEDWLGTEPEIDESKVAKTVDVDVAVVGCGIAGVAACRSVAEDGGLVAAFEKADGPQCRSGEYAVINGKVQAKWGRDTWTREQIDDIMNGKDPRPPKQLSKVRRKNEEAAQPAEGEQTVQAAPAEKKTEQAPQTESPEPEANAKPAEAPSEEVKPEDKPKDSDDRPKA